MSRAERADRGPGAAYTIRAGDGPLAAAAIHAGGALRPEVAARLALGDRERRREEDPFTDRWTAVAPTRIVAHRSRFEVDLNRPREGAVYRRPEHAWGLEVWREPPPDELVEVSLSIWDAFYAACEELLEGLAERFGRFCVLDVHSYNHRRDGPGAPPEDPEANPEINVGTASLDRGAWGPLVDRFMADLAAHPVEAGTVPTGRLDVRENVRFGGGHFPAWINSTFAGRGCALAIEVKKIYMDEWSGEADPATVAAIGRALAATVPGLLEELER